MAERHPSEDMEDFENFAIKLDSVVDLIVPIAGEMLDVELQAYCMRLEMWQSPVWDHFARQLRLWH